MRLRYADARIALDRARRLAAVDRFIKIQLRLFIIRLRFTGSIKRSTSRLNCTKCRSATRSKPLSLGLDSEFACERVKRCLLAKLHRSSLTSVRIAEQLAEGEKWKVKRENHRERVRVTRELQFYGDIYGDPRIMRVSAIYQSYSTPDNNFIRGLRERWGLETGGGGVWEETHARVHHSTESERDNPLNNARAVTAILIGFERKTPNAFDCRAFMQRKRRPPCCQSTLSQNKRKRASPRALVAHHVTLIELIVQTKVWDAWECNLHV